MKPAKWTAFIPIGGKRVLLIERAWRSGDGCWGLRRYYDHEAVENGCETVTRWRPSLWERIRIAFGGSVYVRTLGASHSRGTEPPLINVTAAEYGSHEWL